MSVASRDMYHTALSQNATLYYAATAKRLAVLAELHHSLAITRWHANCYLVIHSIEASLRAEPD
ncbi:MAG: hypothetical protein QOD93_3038 [Acetobacteraceae bacterium]|jgi:hypothetical protein|nr:hypothetical protein [Rhodopila sp.]MEA2732537.1 hypothetical protein [Acetobacteraceae bacterium]MEA2770076.1 hypothetical protein [Acetobacteraceae bacterium]